MATMNEHKMLTIVSAADMTGLQFRAVGRDGDLAATSTEAIGILQNKPNVNEHAAVAYSGELKGYAGALIAAGAKIAVTASGWLVTTTSATAVGKALVAASSGSLVTGIFDFAQVGS